MAMGRSWLMLVKSAASVSGSDSASAAWFLIIALRIMSKSNSDRQNPSATECLWLLKNNDSFQGVAIGATCESHPYQVWPEKK